MLDRRGIAHACRNRGLFRVRRVGQQLVGIGAVVIDLGRVGGQLLVVGHGDDRQGPGHASCRYRDTIPALSVTSGSWIGLGLEIGLGSALVPLAHAHQQVLAIGRHGDRGRIPARGDESLDWLRLALAMSTTATQLLSALATYSVLPSGATARASGVLPSGARGNRAVMIVSVTMPRLRVDHGDAIGRRAGHEDAIVLGMNAIWFGCSPT